MNKPTKFIVLIILIFSFFLILNLLSGKRGGNSGSIDLYSDSQGNPMFATGNCNTDLDCFASGCSNHICANHEVDTTCENIDFPDKEAYSCGCIENKCVWFQ